MTRYRYTVTLEWTGGVEVDPEPDDDDETLREAAFDMALDDALSSPTGYSVVDYELREVEDD